MRGFKAVDGGWESPLEDWELEFLADLLAQVLVILDSAAPSGPRGGRPAGAAPSGPGGPRAAESARATLVAADGTTAILPTPAGTPTQVSAHVPESVEGQARTLVLAERADAGCIATRLIWAVWAVTALAALPLRRKGAIA